MEDGLSFLERLRSALKAARAKRARIKNDLADVDELIQELEQRLLAHRDSVISIMEDEAAHLLEDEAPRIRLAGSDDPLGNVVERKPLTKRLVALISSDHTKPWSLDDICRALPAEVRTTVSGTLSSLVKQGRILRVSRGKWRALPGGADRLIIPDDSFLPWLFDEASTTLEPELHRHLQETLGELGLAREAPIDPVALRRMVEELDAHSAAILEAAMHAWKALQDDGRYGIIVRLGDRQFGIFASRLPETGDLIPFPTGGGLAQVTSVGAVYAPGETFDLDVAAKMLRNRGWPVRLREMKS